MYPSRSIFFLLVLFVAITTARPLHGHMRRQSCRHQALASVVAPLATEPSPSASVADAAPSVSATATPSNVNASDNDDSNSTDDSEPTKKPASPTPSTPAPSSTAVPKPQNLANNGKLAQLFPVAGISKSWSTSPLADKPVSLSDSTFRPTKVLKTLPIDFTNAPDGKKALKAHFPKGSYTFGHQPQGGLSFYAPGPNNVDLSSAKEATFGYSVFFEEGFQFNKGGKLPGIYGGNNDETATSCSGGRRSSECFSARLMWRSGGAGEFYTYLPPLTDPRFAANKKQCNVAPESDCNDKFGASVGRGAFKFTAGQWTTISERVRLNDVGQANGELELFANGKSVISVKGLILRDSAAGKMRGIQMQTFFGGGNPSFASPKSQDVYFSDFSVAITETL